MRVILFAISGLVLVACGGEEGRHTAPSAKVGNEATAGNLLLTEAANGTSATLAVGETLRIKLKSIPTAGYVWQVSKQPDGLEWVGESQEMTDPENQSQPGFTGGSHFIIHEFRATAEGTGRLVLIEGRPWEIEAGSAPEATWTLDVIVTPKP